MVLVTGSTGLVGSHLLLYLLEKGEKVRALYRSERKKIKVAQLFKFYNKENFYSLIEWIEGDITDVLSLEKAFHQIEYVYHCASLISFDTEQENILRKINIEGTANIVNIAVNNKIKKLCYVSSIVALGDDSESIITESTEWLVDKSHSDYAITKHGAEMEIWRGQEEGLNIIIVNPGIIFGPGFWEDGSGKIFSTIVNGFKYYTKGSSGFVAVTDVIVAMFELMKNNIKGERFTLVAENIIFQDIVIIIASALKVKVPKIYAKPWMTSIAWRLDWFLSKIMHRKRKLSKVVSKSCHKKEIYSNEKIKNALNYNFTDIKEFINKIAVTFPKK